MGSTRLSQEAEGGGKCRHEPLLWFLCRKGSAKQGKQAWIVAGLNNFLGLQGVELTPSYQISCPRMIRAGG